ncbi:XdhC family protein [Actinoplanes utahensis]|uniref:XdhC family protein n=1 Tax=Actinoplanes utahensis TaxID=1869 RepID=UPI000A0619FE|nr:XdhC family protein [Actinoplanes utahensis]
MREIVDGLLAWRAAGTSFAVATVVHTWRSAPRRPGAAMAVSEHGDVLGSVSGGCVEGAVYAAAQEVITTGKAQTHTYGVSDGDALSVGLTCGGTIEIMIQPDVALHALDDVLAAIAAGRPVATVSLPDAQLVVWPDRTEGTLTPRPPPIPRPPPPPAPKPRATSTPPAISRAVVSMARSWIGSPASRRADSSHTAAAPSSPPASGRCSSSPGPPPPA